MNQFKIKKGLIVNGDGGTILDIQGSNGELFSVNDNFSGILFSVNNISGLPIMTVSSDNSIVMGQFGLNVLTLIGNSVGIGTASPTANLHVVGNARVTGAIFDSTNAPGTSGQVLTSTVTGTDWKSLAEISGVDGTGTANYLSKWADADTITNSIIYDNGTNVGIGTATPNNKLTVNGNIETTGAGKIGFNVNDSYGSFPHYGLGYAGGVSITNLAGYFGLSFGTSGTERMRITGTGNVGIGTTSPNVKLQVVGDIRITANDPILYLTPNSGTEVFFQKLSTSNGDFLRLYDGTNYSMFWKNANVGIGTSSPQAKLQVNYGATEAGVCISGTSGDTWFPYTNGINYIRGELIVGDNAATNVQLVTGGGNVGIGTASPAARFTVQTTTSSSAHSLRVTDGTGVINIGHWDTVTNRFELSGKPTYFIQYGTGNYISFGTLGSENMRIQAGGNVGIGTTSPNRLLQVAGSVYINTNLDVVGTIFGSTNKMLDQSATSTRLYDAAGTLVMSLGSGNVGIGTTAPNAKLDIAYSTNPTTATPHIILSTGGTVKQAAITAESSAVGGLVFSTGDGTLVDRMTILRTSGNVGIGTTSPFNKLTVGSVPASGYGLITISSDWASGSAISTGIKIGGAADSGGAGVDIRSHSNYAASSGTEMSLWTNSTSNVITERMRISSGGNVGIGTTSPAQKLHVSGFARANGVQISDGTTTAFIGQEKSWTGTGTSNNLVIASETGFATNFYTDGTATVKMTITSAGNVGIGTTSPDSILHVNGTRAHFGTGVSDIKIWGTPATGGNFNIGQSSATGRINFVSSADANLVTITNAGNVGIGTTAPVGILHLYKAAAATRLAIDGDAGQNRLISYRTGALQRFGLYVDNTVESGSNAGSNFAIRAYSDAGTLLSTPFFINRATGNVGIGTTSPNRTLTVNGLLGVTNGTANTQQLVMNTDANGAYLTSSYIGSSSYVPMIFETGGSERMRITSSGNVGIGTTSPGAKLHTDGTTKLGGGTLQVSTDQTFLTNYSYTIRDAVGINNPNSLSAATATTVMSIGSMSNGVSLITTGNVGIGTTAPGTKLQVDGTIRATGASGIVDVDPLYGAFRFYNGSTFYGGFYNDAVLSAGNAVDLVSYVATGNYYIGSATTAKAVKVEQGGNVGIGTTSPTTKLDVNGVVNANSFSAGGTAGFTGTVVFATNPPGSQMLDFQGGLLVSVS